VSVSDPAKIIALQMKPHGLPPSSKGPSQRLRRADPGLAINALPRLVKLLRPRLLALCLSHTMGQRAGGGISPRCFRDLVESPELAAHPDPEEWREMVTGYYCSRSLDPENYRWFVRRTCIAELFGCLAVGIRDRAAAKFLNLAPTPLRLLDAIRQDRIVAPVRFYSRRPFISMPRVRHRPELPHR
jgi:hypothetical protein